MLRIYESVMYDVCTLARVLTAYAGRSAAVVAVADIDFYQVIVVLAKTKACWLLHLVITVLVGCNNNKSGTWFIATGGLEKRDIQGKDSKGG